MSFNAMLFGYVSVWVLYPSNYPPEIKAKQYANKSHALGNNRLYNTNDRNEYE